MLPTIHGKTYKIIRHGESRAYICHNPGRNEIWIQYPGGEWSSRPWSIWIFETYEMAALWASQHHDKPKMTPEERRAALVACGWDA